MTVYVLLVKKKGVQNDYVTVALQESTPSYIQKLEYQATGHYGNTQTVGLHVLIKTLWLPWTHAWLLPNHKGCMCAG